jgi:hypothetical protein
VRKATLASLLRRAAPGLRFNEHLDNGDGPLVFAHACKLGLEGICRSAAIPRILPAARATGSRARIRMRRQ